MNADVAEHFNRYMVDLGFAARAAAEYADDMALDAHADGDWRSWSPARQAVAREQLVYRWTKGLYPEPYDVDGLVGPGTRYAREAYAYWREHGKLPDWRDHDQPAGPGGKPATAVFPRERDLIDFYGQPGEGNSEVRRQLVRVPCPWPLELAWKRSERRTFLWAHRKCADQLGEVLEQVHDHYGPREIVRLRLNIFSGDYVPRPKRGGTSWSTHAFGAAWDFADEWNQLRWDSRRALFARPEYDDWWEIWEDLGFVSLGRERDYDWMHVQAARL